MTRLTSPSLTGLYTNHPRRWRDFDYVYPVVSRRSKGLSVGINLNPDKVCNWDCVYCQVDRTMPSVRRDVDLGQLSQELDRMLVWASNGDIWQDERFGNAPASLRRLNDIAFSGDGEPTTYARFDEAVRIAIDLRNRHNLNQTRIIVLTNMTMAHRQQARAGLELLREHNGEIWAKLESGTEAYFQRIDRSAIKLSRVLDNIRDIGAQQPLVIQSMFARLNGHPIDEREFDAYLDRLEELLGGGCQIRLVQLYTVARRTTEDFVSPLSVGELEALDCRFRQRLPGLPCEVFCGPIE